MNLNNFLSHYGIKGQRWGVRRDEKALSTKDYALNVSQRSQVKLASTMSALASVGMATNAAATLFQLQARWERLQIVQALLKEAENNPLLNEAARESLAVTKNNVIKGIVGSALATTAVSLTIGLVTQKAAKAYFAPIHKVYGDAKGKINGDLRSLSKEIKKGSRPSMTNKQYYAEVSAIVEKHMTKDKSNLLAPFREVARSQMGTEYNTKKLDIKFEKLPNTDLYSKMTVTTPNGLILVKAIKEVAHAKTSADIDFYFDYKFDKDGFISEFTSPTLEVLDDILSGRLDLDDIESRFIANANHSSYKGKSNVMDENPYLSHKGRTVQDIYDSFTDSEKELSEIIVGAALEDADLSGNADILTSYDKLSVEKKDVIDFLVGHIGDGEDLEHAAISSLNDFLAHYGVKGQKWGVRKDRSSSYVRLSQTRANNPLDRREAKERVRAGKGTLGDAHLAGLKSTGHRALNAFTGDKTFWKRQAQIAGFSVLALGVVSAAPMLLPASALTAIGSYAAGSLVAGSMPYSSLVNVGSAAIISIGLGVTQTAGAAATVASQVTNVGRAIRGNARIDKSYEALGKNILSSQTTGNKKVKKVLNRSGSIGKRKLNHSDVNTFDFLSHHLDNSLDSLR